MAQTGFLELQLQYQAHNPGSGTRALTFSGYHIAGVRQAIRSACSVEINFTSTDCRRFQARLRDAALGYDRFGLCENVLPEALTTRDFGEVVVFGHLAMWWMLIMRAQYCLAFRRGTFSAVVSIHHMAR